MTTNPATKRMRLAALGLSSVLTIGVLTPFIGIEGASAATSCSTASSHYATANAKLGSDQAKLHKAKKKLKKLKRHHRSHRVIKHQQKKVKKLRAMVRADRAARNNYYSQQTNCTTASNQAATGTAGALTSLLGQLQGVLDPAQLTDALDALATQLAASGAPGAAQLADVIKQLSAAISSGADSIDPSQLTSLFSQLSALGLDPTAIEKAFENAVATFQNFDFSSLTTNPAGLVDLILGSLANGLTTAGVPTLPGVISQLNDVIDGVVAALTGGGSSSEITSALTQLLGSLGGGLGGGLGGLG
ncbi:hypothetical protein P5P86_19210 [Nocardioides sp. BP30]|uniref:hypothetical protein n=1 Tax=Nocardioides sp. BP30 TaxID=3036374 RepID=UPI002468F0FB|nr:hypothetical protein [Nocardioides sp. BP30]WGL52066.1 hypothetical protein P5P86_19210 [Nocardioides sp. BP30]